VRPKTRLGGPTTMAWADSSPCEARLDADRQYVDRRGRMGEVAARAALGCMIGDPLDFTISAHGRHQWPSSTDQCQCRGAGASCQEAYGVTPGLAAVAHHHGGPRAAFLDSCGQLLGGKPLSEGEGMRRGAACHVALNSPYADASVTSHAQWWTSYALP
jgi:hypothetical protein